MTDSVLPRIYTSRDTDAPTLTSEEPTSLIHLLSKVLVEGYGDQPSLGWEKQERDDGKQAAFKSTVPGRDICWLWVNADDPNRKSRERAVQGLVNFSGFDSNGDPIFDSIFGKDGYFWRVGMLDDTGEVDWLILGNSYFFYFFVGQQMPTGTLSESICNGPPDDEDYYAAPVFCFGSLAGDFVENSAAIISSTDITRDSEGDLHRVTEFFVLGDEELDELSVGPGGTSRMDVEYYSMRPASSDAGRDSSERPYPNDSGLLTSPISVYCEEGVAGMLPGIKVAHHDIKSHFVEMGKTGRDFRLSFLDDAGGERFFVMPASRNTFNSRNVPIYIIDMLEGW